MSDIEQRTADWFEIRRGKVTASRVSDVMAKTKTGYSASRENYMAELVIQRITGHVEEGYTNAAMQWGIDQEPLARAAYEAKNSVLVDEVGFIPHPTIEWAGASPDGLVGEGMLEIKCPNPATTIETWLTETVPAKYFAQMQFQMACANRPWCDYVVYDPRMPQNLQLFVKRVERDNKFIADMEAEIIKFLGEVSDRVNKLNAILEKK